MPLYARSSDLAIITASITDKHSFDALDQWIELVQNACTPCPPLVLAVNKMDDYERATMTSDEINDLFKDKFRAIFFVSALSGENIDQLFNFVALEANVFSKQNAPAQPEVNVEEKPKSERHCC